MRVSHHEITDAPEEKSLLMLSANAPRVLCDSLDITVLTSFEEAQLEGEPDLIVELIDLYLADTTHKVAVMHEALRSRDGSSLKLAAHSLRGSSSNLGARRMAELCEQLEHSDDDDLFEKTGMLIARMEREFELVRQAFSAERQRRL